MVNTCQLFTTTIKLDILQVPTLYSPNPFAPYKKNHGVIKAPKINLFNKAPPNLQTNEQWASIWRTSHVI